jgi:hypothetical protein
VIAGQNIEARADKGRDQQHKHQKIGHLGIRSWGSSRRLKNPGIIRPSRALIQISQPRKILREAPIGLRDIKNPYSPREPSYLVRYGRFTLLSAL